MNNALIASNLTKKFDHPTGPIRILHTTHARFYRNESYAIMGASGSGKSTFMHILAGIELPTSGTVFYDDRDIFSYNRKERAHFLQHTIGLVCQAPYLLKELTVLENVMTKGLITHADYRLCLKKADELIELIELSAYKNEPTFVLSGGQQQRVAIARALCMEPAFLLADEPTGNLDHETGKTIIDLLLHCHKQYKMGLIISSHDQNVWQRMQHRYQLQNGSLCDVTKGIKDI